MKAFMFLISVLLSFCLVKGEKRNHIEHVFDDIGAFHVRDGLPNFSEKIKKDRYVNIGYLGGSITEASDGWRDITYNWFRVNFPYTIISQINGGIGGTGSELGVFRIESDILTQSPDLIFVEFAVNDGGKPREYVLKNMEGIVRKIWKNAPDTDICFVYTVDETKCKNLAEGKIDPTVLYMEEIADYYHIPSIHLGMDIVRLQKKGKLVFTAEPEENANKIVFTKDRVHPLTESGHPIYAAQVIRYLPEMMENEMQRLHVLPAPYVTNNRSGAEKIKISGLKKLGTWELLAPDNNLNEKYSRFLPEIYRGKPGSKIIFSFRGTTLGLYDIVGPESGYLKVTVDGNSKEYLRFDKYSTYNRISGIILFDNLEDKEHSVEIEVLSKIPDRTNILQGEYLDFYKKNQASFKNIGYYIGDILIDTN